MKKIMFMVFALFGMFAFANTSPPDIHIDVGDQIEVIQDSFQTTTIDVETSKHLNRLDSGFELVSMHVKHVDQGAFLVIQYEFDDCLFVYCSNILKDVPDILERTRNSKSLRNIKDIKISKPTIAFYNNVDYHYLC